MKVPTGESQRALIIVDIQPEFITEQTRPVMKKILDLLDNVEYKFYARVFFSCQKDSIWHKQQNYILPKSKRVFEEKSDCPIQDILENKNHQIFEKETKSAFKANPDLNSVLAENRIKEIHLVGVDTYDCVLATAMESFDLGYLTYVIEECCQSNNGLILNDSAINILQDLKMTNKSCISTNTFTEV